MKGLIIIPYRDRQTHLDCLLNRLGEHFKFGWQYESHSIMVVEQADDKPFNKGLLFNAAVADVIKILPKAFDYFILHDVDFIPDRTVDYSPVILPTLLSTECSQFDYGHHSPSFFGGVIGVTREQYIQVNGFSNMYKGWGCEDEDFRKRFYEAKIHIAKRFGNRFENFTHPRHKDENLFMNNNKLMNEPVHMVNGLSNYIDYIESAKVNNEKIKEYAPYLNWWLSVATNGK